MHNKLLTAAMLLLVTIVGTGTVQAQFMANVGLSSETLGGDHSERNGSLAEYAAIAMLPTLTYAQNNNMPVLAESMQDAQFIGAGLAYGSEIEKLGLQIMYLYFITAKLALGGDITFFFPEKFNTTGFESKVTWITFNVLARYLLYQTEALYAYAMGGIALTAFRSKVEGFGQSVTNSDSELGLNLGGGLAYALGFAALYVELSYILGDADQLVIAGGLRFPLGGR